MTPLDASTLFATLVGLICNWKAERGAAASDKFQDFLVYLERHNFTEISAQIAASMDLQRELQVLLRVDFATTSAKLDDVCRGLSSLSEKMDALAPIVRTLGATADELSDQAMSVLKIIEQTGTTRAIMFHNGQHWGLMPGGGQFGFSEEPRFIHEDMEMLVAFGILKLADYNGSGDPIYSITRQGVSLAKDRPEIRDGEGQLIGAKK